MILHKDVNKKTHLHNSLQEVVASQNNKLAYIVSDTQYRFVNMYFMDWLNSFPTVFHYRRGQT